MIGSGCRGLFHLFKRKETSLKILLSVREIQRITGRYFDWKILCIGMEKT